MKVESIIGQWYDVNCYAITNVKNQCLIVDAGAKLDDIKKLTEGKNVVGILLTHAHFDHALYLKEYIDFFKVPTFASAIADKVLKDYTLNQAETWAITDTLPLTLLNGDGSFKVGDFEVKYFATPGHSPCSVCYLIEGNLMAGDVLFHSGIGRLDLVGSDKKAMIESLQKLSTIQFEKLYSGHGEESDYARQKRNIAAFLRFLSR